MDYQKEGEGILSNVLCESDIILELSYKILLIVTVLFYFLTIFILNNLVLYLFSKLT